MKSLYDRDPSNMELAFALGYARSDAAGQLAQAKPLLDAVVVANPANDIAWTLLGLIARKSDDPDNEIAMYKKAIEADPHSVLALTNLASRTMDDDAHRARGYLATALESMEPDNPHRACAFDLMGNSYALIEKDYVKEGEFHRQASQLNQDSPLYRDNLILSLLSSGKSIDARHVWQKTKRIPSSHPIVTEKAIQAFCDETLHPYEYFQLVDAVAPIISSSWAESRFYRVFLLEASFVGPTWGKRFEFLESLAVLASNAENDELALSAWREAASSDASGGVRVNEAVALQRMGRFADALSLIESLSPVGDRFYTVLGNIRLDAGLLGAAVDAYRKAVESEPLFALPFENAFECIDRLREPSLVEPFMKGRIQAVVATRSLSADRRNRSSASAGVFQSSVFRGRELRAAALRRSSLEIVDATRPSRRATSCME